MGVSAVSYVFLYAFRLQSAREAMGPTGSAFGKRNLRQGDLISVKSACSLGYSFFRFPAPASWHLTWHFNGTSIK